MRKPTKAEKVSCNSYQKKESHRPGYGLCLSRWEIRCIYTKDARLHIDNNLAENSFRPVALGRKNYLFAGSHEAAKEARFAM